MNICIICKSNFEAKIQKKTCSQACFVKHRNNRREQSNKNILEDRTCLYCKNSFKRIRYKAGNFCNRSCASKYYVSNGTYDKWISHTNEKSGFVGKCFCCDNEVYYPPKYKKSKKHKICSPKCKREYMKQMLSGVNNPMFGRQLTRTQKDKQQASLHKKYGVTNAYMLAQRRKISKPQKELFDYVQSINSSAELEVKLPIKEVKYFADILLPSLNKVIEYHGDYWHANPKIYSPTYFHKVKNKTAKEIWQDDEKRKNIINQAGYSVMIVWASDMQTFKEATLKKIKDFIYE